MFHQPIFDKSIKEKIDKSQFASNNTINNNTANLFFNTANLFLPVARMVHMLSVKVKKINYFLLCRLEANLKKNKVNNPSL
jgi:hypothetical protein